MTVTAWSPISLITPQEVAAAASGDGVADSDLAPGKMFTTLSQGTQTEGGMGMGDPASGEAAAGGHTRPPGRCPGLSWKRLSGLDNSADSEVKAELRRRLEAKSRATVIGWQVLFTL